MTDTNYFIYVWPNGTACTREELSNIAYKIGEDDYEVFTEEEFYNTIVTKEYQGLLND